jgi:tetratricopeptide (TPR) repeat protein
VTAAGLRWFLGVFAACLAASLAVYWPALRGDYIWDDRDLYILNNGFLRRPDGLYIFWLTNQPADYYPLTYTVFWVGVRLWGYDPLGFHLTNVVVHALASAFLAWTLKGLRFRAAFLVGLLFALHPMNVESVAWMSQLKTCMAGMFAFAAAGCFVRGWRWTSLILFVLSLSSKPIAVAFPVAILAYGWWRDGRVTKAVILQSLPFFAASLVFGAVGVYFQQANAIGPANIRSDSTLTRLLASSWAVWFYLWKGVAPVALMFVYPRWDVPGAGWLGFLPAIILLAVAVVCWRKRQDWGRAPLAALAVYLLMILPSSGLVDVFYWRYTYVGDHYAYQALPVILAAAVGFVVTLMERTNAPAFVGRLLAFAAMAFLAVQSVQLSKDYKDDVTLWTATLERNPKAWLARNNLALRMFERGELETMEKHVAEAYRLRPDLEESHNTMGLILARKGRHEEAAERFREAVKLAPFRGVMWENLGIELAKLGRDDEAAMAFEESIRLMEKTRYSGPREAHPLCEYANLLSRMGRYDEAETLFQRAERISPRDSLIPLGRGHLESRRGNLQAAAAEYRRATELAPSNGDAHWRLGRTLEVLGDSDGAFRAFISGSERSTEAFLALSWMRSASPKKELRNPAKALADVEAMQPAGVFAALVFDVHAVALAANGRFNEALKSNEDALAACRSSAVKDLAAVKGSIARLVKRGELYRRGEAFVGPVSEMSPVLARE